jgi:hypothetical protein
MMNLLRRLGRIGVTDDLPTRDARHVILLNYIVLLDGRRRDGGERGRQGLGLYGAPADRAADRDPVGELTGVAPCRDWFAAAVAITADRPPA